jgi:hypothetical protein
VEKRGFKCLPVRIDPDEVIRIDVFASHFHASRAEVLRAVVRLGIERLFEEYRAAPHIDVVLKFGGAS